MERLFEKCLNITSFFEGNDGYSNIARNFDNQILSLGCLCFTVKSGLVKKLFEIVVNEYPNFKTALSEEAERFVIAILNDDHYLLLKKQFNLRWIKMVKEVMGKDEVVASQKTLAYKTFYIPSLIQADKIRKEYQSIDFTDLLTIFCFDILVQNGSFKKSIKQSTRISDQDVMFYVKLDDSLSSEQVALLKILHSRAMSCPTTYRKDVLLRKLAIIKKEENTVVHGKKFSFKELEGAI